jgi:peroxiredoxin/YHS domain-containing protein
VAAAVLAIVAGAAFAAAKAVCVVCAVQEGTSTPEEVHATREYRGATYSFCSKECAEAFDADPLAYVPAAALEPAPAVALEDLAGKTVELEDYRGQVVLVDFWATWCVPCRKTMPELQRVHERYRPRGFTVLGVSIDEEGAKRVKPYLKGRKLTYPMLLDLSDHPAWEAFRVKAVPAAFLLDREGRIVRRWLGAVDVAEIEAEVERLLAEPASG